MVPSNMTVRLHAAVGKYIAPIGLIMGPLVLIHASLHGKYNAHALFQDAYDLHGRRCNGSAKDHAIYFTSGASGHGWMVRDVAGRSKYGSLKGATSTPLCT